jgi:signal transduction histidine kinase
LDYLAVYCFALLVSLYGLLLAWFWLQATMRPVLADIAVKAPAANRVEGANQSVVLKMLIALVYATTLAGLIVGSLQRRPGSGARGMLATGALGFGASLSVILILVLLAGLRVLEPLRELIRGTEAVATGYLEVQVPVTSNDELGMLAQSFNEMVSGLRDRERLRKDNLGLVDELRASRERIVTTADQERRRLERDLHDGAQQHLVLLGLKLGMLNRMISKDPVRSEHLVEELQADLGHAVKELRDLAHGLYPAVLETDGLDGALREAANHAPIPTKISCDSTSRYPSELEAAVYFCCLEALQNAAKHAGKRAHATIRLEHNDSTLQFEVIDDGQGFNPATAPASAGLQNMSDRIGALGGTLTVNSEPGSGTTILGRIPIHT